MWVWFHRKVHMTFVIIALYIFMCPASANNQITIRNSKKSSNEAKMSPLQMGNYNTIRDVSKTKESDLCQPLERNSSSISEKMRDYLKFIDLRERYKRMSSEINEDPKVVIDLDQSNVNVLGELPKKAALFSKKVIEEETIVDIPKSSLFRKKRTNPLKKLLETKVPPEIRLYYKTSTPVFRYGPRHKTTTRFFKKMYKAFAFPWRKFKETKRNMKKPKNNKRSSNYIKPTDVLTIMGRKVPKVCHASHFPPKWTYSPMGYLKKHRKISNEPFVSLEKSGHESTTRNFKKSTEISEAALFQIINKLIQDTNENKTVFDLGLTIPTPGAFLNLSMEASHRRNKQRGPFSSQMHDPNFNLAVIIAKITQEPENHSSIATQSFTTNSTIITTPSTSDKFRYDERSSSRSSTTKNPETTVVCEFTKRFGDKHEGSDSSTEKFKANCTQEVSSVHQNTKEGFNSLLKEIIRHVSIALDAVTTSREFLDLILCETAKRKTTMYGQTHSYPLESTTDHTTHIPINTTKKESSFNTHQESSIHMHQESSIHMLQQSSPHMLQQSSPHMLQEGSTNECFEPDMKNWLKTKDNCTVMGSFGFHSTLEDAKESRKDNLKDNFSSGPNQKHSTNIDCESDKTSTQCTVFLEDDEEYFEPFNMTGNAPLLVLPEDIIEAEYYQTASYKIKNNAPTTFNRKMNRKKNVSMEAEEMDEPDHYEARDLIRELGRYHMMLQDPIVTKIWPFFQVTARTSIPKPPLLKRLKKRKTKMSDRIHKSILNDNNILQRKPKLIKQYEQSSNGKSNAAGFEPKKHDSGAISHNLDSLTSGRLRRG